jgi:carbamoyltransferase
MTSYLGFNANRDEGKLMGLAAYGEAGKENNPWIDYFNNIISVANNKLVINPYFFKIGSHENSPYYTDFLVDYITSIDKNLPPIKHFKDGNKYLSNNYIDLAYAAQYKLEEALIFVVKELIQKTNLKKLCISGGLGLNCKANQSIFKECGLEEIFIHPAASDDGSAIGAAFYLSSQFDGFIKSPINNVYFGASYSNYEIEEVLKNCGIKYSKPNEIFKETAKLLNNNQIIGWFQDRSEMGARALGARSIIANPFDVKIKDKINKEVKYREAWRPYCPSILSEFADKYLKDSLEGKYMILACDAKNELKEKAPAVVHIDNTVRPQCVKKEDTPKWYELLSEFNALSDIPVLLNTSFNVRGEPIVNSPYDAIRTFYSTGLNSLVIGDFIITKL